MAHEDLDELKFEVWWVELCELLVCVGGSGGDGCHFVERRFGELLTVGLKGYERKDENVKIQDNIYI